MCSRETGDGRFSLRLCLLLLAVTTATCSADGLSIQPQDFVLHGPRVRLQLTVRAGQQSQTDVTRQIEFSVDVPDVITISKTGQVIPCGNGVATVTAKLGESTASTKITVEEFKKPSSVSPSRSTPTDFKLGCQRIQAKF